MTELTPADRAFQDACVAYLTSHFEAGTSPVQAMYEAVSCLASFFGSIAVDRNMPLETMIAMTENMLVASREAIVDIMMEATAEKGRADARAFLEGLTDGK